MSQEVGKPVRLQHMRWDETGWDNYAPAMVIEMSAGVDANGNIVAYELNDWHQAFSVAAQTNLETGVTPSDALTTLFVTGALIMGGQYVIPNRSVVNHFVKTGYLKANTMRSPMDIPSVFASEQTIDELAHAVSMDPVAFRRQNMTGNDLWLGVLNAVAQAANWQPKVSGSMLSDANVVTGRGVCLTGHSSGGGHTSSGQPATVGQPTAAAPGIFGAIDGGIDFTNTRDTAAAVVADIEVNKKTGKIVVKHLYAAMTPGLTVNPASVENQIIGQQVMGTSRAMVEALRFDKRNVTSQDWVTYPILRFKDAPKVTPIVVQRLDEPNHGGGEETMAGPAAAIANAFFDATGVRIREVPMTPDAVRATLKAAGVA
jgi:CO/xanthine dehydrogenase Mo-binding subunit